MLDYRGIEALCATLEHQSFEEAANRLHMTQSAVSQRIKNLEAQYGEPLMVRTLPYKPTALGEKLVTHFKRISVLEDDLASQITSEQQNPRMSIALNRDSLETWFLDFIKEHELLNKIRLEVIADDQELTLNYLKHGHVSACLTTSKKPIVGGEVHFLGNMEYVLVSSPDFFKTHFLRTDLRASLKKAPAVKFDQNDKLHEHYLDRFFKLREKTVPFHILPSVRGFKQLVLSGYGYALLPTIDIQQELNEKKLQLICESNTLQVPLFWHHWSLQSTYYQDLNQAIINHSRRILQNV